MANYLRQYWDSYGGKIVVTTSGDRRCAFSVKRNDGPDDLPKTWEKPGQKVAYVLAMKKSRPQLVAYINREILPAHDRMSRPLDSATAV